MGNYIGYCDNLYASLIKYRFLSDNQLYFLLFLGCFFNIIFAAVSSADIPDISDAISFKPKWTTDIQSSPAYIGMSSFFYVEISNRYRKDIENIPLISFSIKASSQSLHLYEIGSESEWEEFKNDRTGMTRRPIPATDESSIETASYEISPGEKSLYYFGLGVDKNTIPQEYTITITLKGCDKEGCKDDISQFETIKTEQLKINVEEPITLKSNSLTLEVGGDPVELELSIENNAKNLEPIKNIKISGEVVTDECDGKLLFCPKEDGICNKDEWSPSMPEREFRNQVKESQLFRYKLKIADDFFCDRTECKKCQLKYTVSYDSLYTSLLRSKSFYTETVDTLKPISIVVKKKPKTSITYVDEIEGEDKNAKVKGVFYNGIIDDKPLKLSFIFKNTGEVYARFCKIEFKIPKSMNIPAHEIFQIVNPAGAKPDGNDLVVVDTLNPAIKPGESITKTYEIKASARVKEGYYQAFLTATCKDAINTDIETEIPKERLYLNFSYPPLPEIIYTIETETTEVTDGDEIEYTLEYENKGDYPVINCKISFSGLTSNGVSLSGGKTKTNIEQINPHSKNKKIYRFIAKISGRKKEEWKNNWKENLERKSLSIQPQLTFKCRDKFDRVDISAKGNDPDEITVLEEMKDYKYRVMLDQNAKKKKQMMIIGAGVIIAVIGGFIYLQKQKRERLRKAGRTTHHPVHRGYYNPYSSSLPQSRYYQQGYYGRYR